MHARYRHGEHAETSDTHDVDRLYAAVAAGEPTLELLQMIYDLFGTSRGLRPPRDEMRLAGRLASHGGVDHG